MQSSADCEPISAIIGPMTACWLGSNSRQLTRRKKTQVVNCCPHDQWRCLCLSSVTTGLVFLSGIQLNMSMGYKSLAISVAMHTDYLRMTRGLLGNFDGDKENDFILPNGTILNSSLTDEEIYRDFGVKCTYV